MDEVRARLAEAPYGFALVVSTERILFGRLRQSAMREAAADTRAEEVMEPGPSTVRADTTAPELAERLGRQGLETAIVTTPEGRLLGVVLRSELEAQSS